MSDTTKQLMQLIHDMGVISERMDAKNRRIEQLEAKVEELTDALKKITEVSVGVFPTNDPFMWLQDIAETALKESE